MTCFIPSTIRTPNLNRKERLAKRMAEYKSYVREVKAELGERRDKALEALAQFGLSEITVRTPVLTGALRDSYDYEIEPDAVTWGITLELCTLG